MRSLTQTPRGASNQVLLPASALETWVLSRGSNHKKGRGWGDSGVTTNNPHLPHHQSTQPRAAQLTKAPQCNLGTVATYVDKHWQYGGTSSSQVKSQWPLKVLQPKEKKNPNGPKSFFLIDLEYKRCTHLKRADRTTVSRNTVHLKCIYFWFFTYCLEVKKNDKENH